MKRNILLSLVCLFAMQTLYAAPITYRQARKTAAEFLSHNQRMRFGTSELTMASPCEEIQPYYIFNLGIDEGFVVVSGDDAVSSILGYADSGHIDVLNMPDNVKAWLDGYAYDIERIQKQNLPAYRYAADDNVNRADIPALITAEWDQKRPFNNQCPYSKDGKYHRPTGCVATAIAQVMYYHKWPQDKTAAIDGYSYKDDKQYGGDGSVITLEPLAPTVFDWDSMLDTYNEGEYDDKSADAVAELMKYVGYSVEMMYGVKASAAFSEDIAGALVHSFGYKKTARHIYRLDYATQDEWDSVIYRELSENRPVIYSGITNMGFGHQFVCDGYENGYFHINWGWSGESNGYFKLAVLDPYNQGIGGAGTGSSFSEFQTAVIGVETPVEHDAVSVGNISAESGEELNIDIKLDNIRTNYTSVQFDIQLPDGIDIMSDTDGSAIVNFNQLRSEKADHIVSINEMTEGKYRFVAYSPDNSLITGNEGTLITVRLKVDGSVGINNYTACISNVFVCDNDLNTREIRGGEFQVEIVPTGIDTISKERDETLIYTTQGILVKENIGQLEKGVYIVNGKKIVVK